MKVRIISAVVVLAILIPLIWLGGYPYVIAISILSILGYKEILDLKKSHHQIPKLMVVLGLISLIYLVLGNYSSMILDYNYFILPFLLLLLPSIFYSKEKYSTNDAFYLIGCVLFLGLVFNLLIFIRNISLYILLYLLCLTVLTDTFAYFIGLLIGKHKMCPEISPKKSWEGAVGGLIGGVIISLIVYANLVSSLNFKVVLLTIILCVVGQIGDLVYSKIKRENEVKDFSNIMPGHGGVLDRLDSFSFVVLAYILLVSLL